MASITNLSALKTYYETWATDPLTTWQALPLSGSERRYYRAASSSHQALVVHHSDTAENRAFVAYTRHFQALGMPVPALFHEDLDQDRYLIEDLGNQTLLQHLQQHRNGQQPAATTLHYYKETLTQLARLQVQGVQGLPIEDYHQPATFDPCNMLWDLNYFKYCYLKTSGLPIDEYRLEQDFQQLTADASTMPSTYFMMRDCQARNVMVHQDRIYFIDYQGGKYGPLAYDVASLLYQAKANLPHSIRTELLTHYLDALNQYIKIDSIAFRQQFYYFVLLRSLQVLGAYGYKGLYQGKTHFIESIPYALDNVAWLLDHAIPKDAYPYLAALLRQLIAQPRPVTLSEPALVPKQLTLTIQSFSYKRGIPKDDSGNGGGFVFDCRFMHNPGRYMPYKTQTGRDEPVQTFLLEQSTMPDFLTQVKAIVTPAIDNYLERNFQHLMVSFGCTGGQHRSVYAADQLVAFVQKRYPQVRIRLWHREQERKGWVNEVY